MDFVGGRSGVVLHYWYFGLSLQVPPDQGCKSPNQTSRIECLQTPISEEIFLPHTLFEYWWQRSPLSNQCKPKLTVFLGRMITIMRRLWADQAEGWRIPSCLASSPASFQMSFPLLLQLRLLSFFPVRQRRQRKPDFCNVVSVTFVSDLVFALYLSSYSRFSTLTYLNFHLRLSPLLSDCNTTGLIAHLQLSPVILRRYRNCGTRIVQTPSDGSSDQIGTSSGRGTSTVGTGPRPADHQMWRGKSMSRRFSMLLS